MIFTNGQDTVNGTQAVVHATIGGRVEEMFYVQEFEASVDLQKEEVNFVGSLATHHKVIGWAGSGSATIHYMTSVFRRIIVDFIKTGRMPRMTLMGTNNDPASTIGTQTVVLKGIILDDSVLFKMANKEVLDDEINFTFEDAEMLDEFNRPITT